MNLSGVKLRTTIDCSSKYTGFCLSKNNITVNLFSDNHKTSQLWIENLKKFCVNLDFH